MTVPKPSPEPRPAELDSLGIRDHAVVILIVGSITTLLLALSGGAFWAKWTLVLLVAVATTTGGRRSSPWWTPAVAGAGALVPLGAAILIGSALGLDARLADGFPLLVLAVAGGTIHSAVLRLPPEWRR